MFSKHAFNAKRKADGEGADAQQKARARKPQRRQEDTPEREGLDDVFA